MYDEQNERYEDWYDDWYLFNEDRTEDVWEGVFDE